MTTPDERHDAQKGTVIFLRQLCDPERTPGVSDELRYRAEGLLRHLASPSEVRDMLEMALRLYHAEQERDQYRTTVVGATRRLLFRVAIVQAVALSLGILIGRLLLR